MYLWSVYCCEIISVDEIVIIFLIGFVLLNVEYNSVKKSMCDAVINNWLLFGLVISQCSGLSVQVYNYVRTFKQ